MTGPSPLRRLARNVGWLVGGKAANAVLGLAVLAVAGRALGAEGLGQLVLLHGLVQLVAELAKFQSWQGVVRYGTHAAPSDLSRLVSFSLLLDGASAVIGMAALALLGRWVAILLGWPAEVAALVPLYGTAVAFLVPGTAQGVLRLFDRFDLLAAQSAIGNVVRVGGALGVWAMGGGLEHFALVWWAAAAVSGLMPFPHALGLLRRAGAARLRWPAGIRRDHPGILRFFVLTSLNAIIALAPTHVATLVVGTLLGAAPAGLYRVAKQFADAAAKPAEFLAQAFYPEAARLQDDRVRLRHMLRRLAVVAGGLALLAVAVLGGAGRMVLDVAMGPDFFAAYPPMVVLAVASALVMAASPLEPLLIALGRAGGVVVTKAAVAALHVTLLLSLAPLGMVWAAAAAVAAALVSVTLMWRLALRSLQEVRERPPHPPTPKTRPPCA